MEGEMLRFIVVVGALVAVALLAPDRAQAGASASAPSKYTQAASTMAPAHHATAINTRHAADTDFSSSSVKTSVPHR
jgi:hypothetical protein